MLHQSQEVEATHIPDYLDTSSEEEDVDKIPTSSTQDEKTGIIPSTEEKPITLDEHHRFPDLQAESLPNTSSECQEEQNNFLDQETRLMYGLLIGHNYAIFLLKF